MKRMSDKQIANCEKHGFSADKTVLLREIEYIFNALKAEREEVIGAHHDISHYQEIDLELNGRIEELESIVGFWRRKYECTELEMGEKNAELCKQLEAVKPLSDKWRRQCGHKRTSFNGLKMDCADELDKALGIMEVFGEGE
jgi:hypothetical protein